MKKSSFVKGLKERTKRFSIEIVLFYPLIEESIPGSIIGRQLIRSATSVAANYRSACLGRSKREFFAKISIVVEEADETLFWLELLKETKLAEDRKLNYLMNESLEILKIMSKAKSTMFAVNKQD